MDGGGGFTSGTGESVGSFSAFTIGIGEALCCSIFPSVTGEMCVMQTAQLSMITCRLSQAGNPRYGRA